MADLTTTVGWVSVGEAIDLWSNAPGEEATAYADLVSLLGAAHEQLEDRAAVLDPPPERYKQAQILYAQHLYARRRAGDGDQAMGADGLAVSTYPLVMEAYSLVARPRRLGRGLR